MYDLITSATEIPVAIAYVCANDTFMSGWGPSKGKINTVICPVSSRTELDCVYDALESRDEMIYVRICYRKPRLNHRYNTYSLFSKDRAPSWYGRE